MNPKQYGKMSGGALAYIRECLAISQQDMAAKLGVSLESLWQWESGERPIPLTVELAAKYLLAVREGLIPEREAKSESAKSILTIEQWRRRRMAGR
jgi:transcriptional regulator with XRE-family HTH domain